MARSSISSGLTGTNKADVRRSVKLMMQQNGQSYDEWLAEQEFQYLINNLNVVDKAIEKST